MPKQAIPYEGKIRIKTGDNVMIISGKDKGKTGKVVGVLPNEGKVIVVDEVNTRTDENGNTAPTPLNAVIKHVKGQPTPQNPNPQGGRVSVPLPIALAKVALVNAEGKPTRIRIQIAEDGTKTRIAVKGGQPIPDPAKG
jgi:large subunit ribosomal protein L24